MNTKLNKNETRNKIIIALIIVLLLGVIAFLLLRPKEQEIQIVDKSKTNISIDNRANGEEKKSPLSGRSVAFSGINDADVSSKTVVYLENLPENDDFYMSYEVEDKDSGKTVFETELIPAGEHVEWVIGDSLTEGEHTLIFHEKPFWQNDEGEWVPLTTGNNEAVFTVH